jgi:thiosulfate reductase cytochrome b subunit
MKYRHSLVTRVTHTTFFLSFLGLAASGAQMYFHQKWLRVPVVPLHEYLGLAMLLSGVVYIVSGIVSGNLGKLLFRAGDAAGLLPMTAYYLRLRKEPPQYDDYNPLQKLAYTAVLLMIAPLIAATGFAMWKHSPLQPPLAEIFGRRSARIWHVGFAVELVLFFAGHMLMVATTGLRNNLRSMVTGWYRVSSPAPQTSAIRETVSTTSQSRPASPLPQARRMPAHR